MATSLRSGGKLKHSSVLLTLLLAPLLPGQVKPQEGRALLTVALRTARGTVKTGAKVSLVITLTNESPKRIYLDVRTPAVCEYAVDVHEENGNTPPEKKYLKALHGKDTGSPTIVQLCGGGPISLEPHQTRTDMLDLNELYDLRKPGSYTIQVSRFDNEAKTWVKSNTIKLIVTPQTSSSP